MNRRMSLGYWSARILLNGAAIGTFMGLCALFGFPFSFTLYWCAFAAYVVLSFGDGVIDVLWPPIIKDQNQENSTTK